LDNPRAARSPPGENVDRAVRPTAEWVTLPGHHELAIGASNDRQAVAETYSIANGVGVGLLLHTVSELLRGRRVSIILIIFSGFFVWYFLHGAI
jgi:hypothetical protein